MPRNASGTYTLPPVYQATPGTTVRSEQHNVPLQDLAQGMTDSLPRNGSAPMTGNLPMGGRRITGLGTPTATTDATTKAYVDGRTGAPASDAIQMDGVGLIGRELAGAGSSRRIFIGQGIEFNAGSLRAQIGAGLSFVAGAITAAVTRFATDAQARGGSNNDSAMTPLNTLQFANANLLGMFQAWESVSRNAGQTYTNNTGKPIMVAAQFQSGVAQVAIPNSGDWVTVGSAEQNVDGRQPQQFIVPNLHRYRIVAASIIFWSELR